MDDGLNPVERKERTEEKNLKLLSLLPVFIQAALKKAAVIAHRQYLHFMVRKPVCLTVIFLVGTGISQNKIREPESLRIDPEVPSGLPGMRSSLLPVHYLSLVAGSQRIKDHLIACENGEKFG